MSKVEKEVDEVTWEPSEEWKAIQLTPEQKAEARAELQKRVDAAFTEAFAPHCGDERARPVGDPVAHLRRDRRCGQNARHRLALLDPAAGADCRT